MSIRAILWLRRVVLLTLLTATLIVLYGAYAIIDSLVRTAVVGGFGFYVQACLWLDRRLTQGLQGRTVVYAIQLRSRAKSMSRRENANH